MHEVGYRIRVDAPGEFTFLRPDHTPVPAAAPTFTADGESVQQANRQLGLSITETTGIPDWDGQPPDYSWAIEILAHVSAETRDEPAAIG